MKLYKFCWQTYTAQCYRAHLQSWEANQSPPWFSQCPGCFFEHSLWPEFFFLFRRWHSLPWCDSVSSFISYNFPSNTQGTSTPPQISTLGKMDQLFWSSLIPPLLFHVCPMGPVGRPPPKYIMNLFTSNSFATTNLSYLDLLLGLSNCLLNVLPPEHLKCAA